MSKLQKAIESGAFTVTGEVGPPKGTDLTHCMEGAELIKDKVAAVNVTDIQTAVMRMSSMSVCVKLLEMGVEPILQMVCRDRNRLALQSDLLGAYALGIRNVLSITGDHIAMGDHKDAMAVYDLDSVGLLQAMSRLESGTDMGRDMKGNPNELEGTPEFFKGCVVTPCSDVIEPQILKLAKKVEAGAQFCQTQAVYDSGQFETFMNEVEKAGIKIPMLVGIVVLKNAGMAKYMNKFVPGVSVPKKVIEEMDSAGKKASDRKKKAAEISARIVNECKACCQGAHIMPLGWDDTIPMIVEQIG